MCTVGTVLFRLLSYLFIQAFYIPHEDPQLASRRFSRRSLRRDVSLGASLHCLVMFPCLPPWSCVEGHALYEPCCRGYIPVALQQTTRKRFLSPSQELSCSGMSCVVSRVSCVPAVSIPSHRIVPQEPDLIRGLKTRTKALLSQANPRAATG